jgi:hypothetical protein
MMAFLIVTALVVLAVDYAIRGCFQREEDALRTHLRGLGLTDEEIEKRTRQREEALKYYFRDTDLD